MNHDPTHGPLVSVADIGSPKCKAASKTGLPIGAINGDRLVDLRAILRKIPVARSTLFAWIRVGDFPPGHKVGPRRRLWRESDVDLFINNL